MFAKLGFDERKNPPNTRPKNLTLDLKAIEPETLRGNTQEACAGEKSMLL